MNKELKILLDEMNNHTQIQFQKLNSNKEELFINGIKARHGKKYTQRQQAFALNTILEYGVRATARILQIPRSTLQNWIRKYNINVSRYPHWMELWRRKKLRMRRIFKGY